MYKTYFPALDALFEAMKGNGACAAKEGLNAHYLHTTEAQRGLNSVYAAGKLHDFDLKADTPLDDCITAYAYDSERQGFINGFRLAALLYRECFAAVPAEAGFIGGYDYPHEKAQEAGLYDWVFKSAPRDVGDCQQTND